MLITRKELDYYRNNDKEIEMHMEKLKRWQLILLRVHMALPCGLCRRAQCYQ